MSFDFDTMVGNDRTVRVVGEMTPFIQAQTYGPPERCYPAEGGEIEDLTISMVHICKDGRRKERELSDPNGLLHDKLEDRIYAHCDERAQDWEADKAEYLRDQKEDR